MTRARAKRFFLSEILLGGLLLSGCGKSLDRVGAMSLLDSLSSTVNAAGYVLPEKWSRSLVETGVFSYDGREVEGTRTQSATYSASDAYFHLALTLVGKIDYATSVNLSSERWVYYDISTTAQNAKFYHVFNVFSNGWTGTKTYSSVEYASTAKAMEGWAEEDSVIEEKKTSSLIQSEPMALKNDLALFASGYNFSTQIYTATDEDSLSIEIKSSEASTGKTANLKAVIREGRIEEKDTVKESQGSTSSLAINWEQGKIALPNLASYSAEEGTTLF